MNTPATLGGKTTDKAIISHVFNIPESRITAIRPLDGGMTNLSFVFEVDGNAYVFRQPGPGTDKLIDRHDEKANYELVAPLNVSDEVYYFDGDTGVKIAKYYTNSHVCDPSNVDEVRIAMTTLKTIHDAALHPKNRFDIEERIAYYQRLCEDGGFITFADFDEVRAKADELLALRKTMEAPEVLCHIDYLYTNVLFLPDGQPRVIDWEYSGASDPLFDVASFCIYALHTKDQIDQDFRFYLQREPTREEKTRLYLYVALEGFLWSIWSEYMQGMGSDFGEYSTDMYQYMKGYYQVLKDRGVLA